MTNLAERLSHAMKQSGLNQPGLARAASKPGAPVSQQVVHHLLSSRNTSSKHLPAIAEALNVSLDWLARGGEPLERGGFALKGGAASRAPGGDSGGENRLPVLGMAECGPDGWSLWNGDVIDMIARPAGLAGVPNAYAVYVLGASMEPRYHPGELVHIHPGKPLTVGAYVLVQRRPKNDGDPPLAAIKRLARRTGSKIVLEQFNPPKSFEIKSDDIVSIHRVVGSGEA